MFVRNAILVDPPLHARPRDAIDRPAPPDASARSNIQTPQRRERDLLIDEPSAGGRDAGDRWAGVLTVIRVFLGITFATYGLVKVLGGQYNYGDWVIDKKTADGTSLVWAFYGYSPFYGRFTGLFELVPAIMLLIPRTATIGAAALFAVAVNVTAMDFGYHYPAVKWFALVYTILLAVLLWADRERLA